MYKHTFNINKMESHIKAQTIPIGTAKQGVWLSPERAAQYFRNGRGLAIGTLYNKLRAGKLNDIAIRDAFGWIVFVPQLWIEHKTQAKIISFNPAA
jgi:hypothetical protein